MSWPTIPGWRGDSMLFVRRYASGSPRCASGSKRWLPGAHCYSALSATRVAALPLGPAWHSALIPK
jgi:hypothetical protein